MPPSTPNPPPVTPQTTSFPPIPNHPRAAASQSHQLPPYQQMSSQQLPTHPRHQRPAMTHQQPMSQGQQVSRRQLPTSQSQLAHQAAQPQQPGGSRPQPQQPGGSRPQPDSPGSGSSEGASEAPKLKAESPATLSPPCSTTPSPSDVTHPTTDQQNSGQQGDSGLPNGGGTGSDTDSRRARRMLANRLSAQRSRMKRMQRISQLERDTSQLNRKVQQLDSEIKGITAANADLQRQCKAYSRRILVLQEKIQEEEDHQRLLADEVERLSGVNSNSSGNWPAATPPPQHKYAGREHQSLDGDVSHIMDVDMDVDGAGVPLAMYSTPPPTKVRSQGMPYYEDRSEFKPSGGRHGSMGEYDFLESGTGTVHNRQEYPGEFSKDYPPTPEPLAPPKSKTPTPGSGALSMPMYADPSRMRVAGQGGMAGARLPPVSASQASITVNASSPANYRYAERRASFDASSGYSDGLAWQPSRADMGGGRAGLPPAGAAQGDGGRPQYGLLEPNLEYGARDKVETGRIMEDQGFLEKFLGF